MNTINKYIIAVFLLFSTLSFAQNAKYKCMLQMTNYKGLEAYVVVSLIDPQGKYEKTVYMMGDDKQWYNGFKEWFKNLSKKKEKISAVTGASVAAGDRTSATFTLDESKMNKGYKLRFETAVEDQKYHVSDVEIPFTTDALTKKTEGKGYIRYVKLNKVQ
ncbi:DUF2271 domain-containing protein [Flavobacterium sp. xlx-214]|uniref:DUF2271 domain-containing protein n=1 Tax=unclassified Flavobacterium TaxID=196869 RepID=UPI0013D78A1A|nr:MULTISPECIES: DUF2271 domain-containing protein [unclassified Flavobacterium]MBA5793004.1 DUF2271 domain-containing protein [Flavobacterium sp. xlx-221]QMI84667.1 DUF2271 domain-containing protein [Flavobacterium sp. xlx-214]